MILSLLNAVACSDAILSLTAFADDADEVFGTPAGWLDAHIQEQWLNVILAFSDPRVSA